MDINLERDGGVIGTLFQQIINDMKNTSPLWEDFMAKANKLHVCLRATIQAISAYLDAFQKIADAATNSRGASKEIGTALTRVCLRHKAVETRMKSFTTAIMDCLILPLQDKVEDWKRQVAVIDKEHAKEYKRCRAELKKRSTDTLRLQKKAKKGQSDSIQSLVESSMHDITQRKADLEEVERRSLRAAMIEERTRFCTFVNLLQPVVKEEFEVMYELGHLQEAMETITNVTKNPNILPQASEELILETKTSASFLYPESPGSHGYSNSLGSRKSSVCSISSINSSGSSNSPGMPYQRSLSQLMTPAIRLKPGESSDSGFCSSPALTTQASTTTNQTHAVSTWPPHSQDPVTSLDRPHTISTAYEKGHQRPPLTVYTFQNPDGSTTTTEQQHPVQKSPANVACRPPLPVRCSSLERPLSSTAGARNQTMHNMRQSPSPLPAHITKEYPIIQPTYVNMSELATMAALKITNSINQHYQQQNQEPLTPIQSHTPNMPFSAQSPQSDSSSVTTTYNNLTTTTNTNTNNTNTTNSMTTNPESPLSTATDDTLSRQASVDAAPSSLNDYDDYVVHDNQTLSSSTSGCVNRNTTRRTANSVKPPPPVRRSSSVTPSHQLDVSHSSLQPNVMNASSESLPPPPAYLLDSTGRTSPGKVGETVKALTELNHMPASPSVLRRNISQISPAAPQTIYSTSNQQQSPTPSQQQHNPFYGSSPQSDYYSTTNQTKQSQSIYSTLQPSHSSHNSSSEQSPSSLPIYLSTRQIQSGIYAQPKHLTKVSSFRNASPNSARNQPGTRVITQLNTSRTNDLHQQIAPPTAQAKTTPSSHPHSNQKIYAQSSYHHTMQSPSPHNSDHTYQQNHEAKAPKTKPERIYTSASDRNYHYHYQQQQQQHHHHHQPQQQQQQHHQQQQQNNQHSVHGMAMSNDGPYSNHHHQQQQQSPYHRHYNVQQKIYVSTNPFIHTTTSHYSPSYSPTSFGKESGPVYATSPPTSTTNYSSPNYETTNNSIRAKSKLGFLENLNAKLAEQRLSGKAFAVRNIINSKALKRVEGGRSQIPVANSNNYANCDEPDPRVCHESLMDQIKRGATLKRNKSINDRSAPKIY
ncbi:protein MTSS 2 isoform X13 [Contarinia nasturtii]|uniref:protein MTSS 2 isoform X13 n=1 Tax=Contarinia nasturtii TaxID=265458 RepID=UPI0012D4C3AA|nr:protein MTSS 2 isoform X13 [Contarinia nasturtii]